ncbi:hypothetical protein HYV11_03610 [Candidatus Dependentiae bacterium]|nr:hypothetical protein [Candidatus Dependentiae bacterium]
MRLELIYGLRLLIITFLAYVPTVTFSGWFTAWVAKKCDDDLPERFGFLTFDPFAHFNIFGFSILLLNEFFGNYIPFLKNMPGFGRFIFLDPQSTGGKFKIFVEFFARAFAHLLMLTFAFCILILVFKWLSINTNDANSLLVSCKDILFFFFDQNRILCNIYLLFAIVDSICFFYEIPRLLSMTYFMILIAVILVLQEPLAYMLGWYLLGLDVILTKVIYG